jgi:hypothetical protein
VETVGALAEATSGDPSALTAALRALSPGRGQPRGDVPAERV